MVNDFVDFSSFVRFNVLLLNSECKGTKKYTHTQVSEHIFLKKKTTPYSPICCLAYKTPTSAWDFWETNHALHASSAGRVRG